MELLADEQFAHVLVDQISQTILVQEPRLQLLDEARENAELTPFKNAKLHVKVLFIALQSCHLSFDVLDLRSQLTLFFVKLLFLFLSLLGNELFVVRFYSFLLLFEQVLSGLLRRI